MDRYRKIKLSRHNWVGFFTGSLSFKRIITISWQWIHSSLHPSTEFAFGLLGFVIPIIDRGRHLFFIRFYTWNAKPAGYLSFSFLYLPSIDFRIGNGKTWFWIRNENYYGWKCHRENLKQYKNGL